MYKFQVFDADDKATEWSLTNCYLQGSDGTALSSEIQFKDGCIVATKKDPGTAALVIQHSVGSLGEVTLQTTQLPERNEPYNLVLELARHRLMVLFNRLEDWAMFDLGEGHAVLLRMQKARQLFIDALDTQNEDPVACQKFAQDCLVNALDGTEELTVAHSELLIERRRVTGSVPRLPVGCGVHMPQTDERILSSLQANFDYVQMPLNWKKMVPKEDEYDFSEVDNWMQWATQNKVPVMAGSLVVFSPSQVPDWLYIWEHDYDTVRDLVYEHVERVVSRYRGRVHTWVINSGLNVNENFSFAVEQLLDLTRMVAMLIRKLDPKSALMVEIQQPWGEYHGRVSGSIPPVRFCDLLSQAMVPFDTIGLRVLIGQGAPGQHVRDLMQVAYLVDSFGHQGKPLHVFFGAPSEPVPEERTAALLPKGLSVADSGCWRRPWSPLIQGRWVEAVMNICMSRPYVESVAWCDIVDHESMELPFSGLVAEGIQPKRAFKHVIHFRQYLQGKAEQYGARRIQDDPTPS